MTRTSTCLRVAMAQINFKVGDIDGNRGRILREMRRARSENADLVVFSELALLGYPPRDIVHRPAFIDRQRQALMEVAEATDESMAAVVGYVGQNQEEYGHQLINAAAFCAGGEVQKLVAKQLLPTYDVFEERRYFHASDTGGVVDWKGVRLGLTICEDAWTDVEDREMPAYDTDPTARCVDDGAEVIINISASPFTLGKGAFRKELLAGHCRRHNRPLLFVNQVGANDELIFDGRSLAIDADGELKARLAEFNEDFQIVEVEPNTGTFDDGAAVRPVCQSRAQEAHRAVVTGIRDYVRKSNFEDVVIGLSGGIDSAVTATLAVDALGEDHVYGVAMPSRYSSDHSREDARQLAGNLGIKFDEIAIEGSYTSMLETLDPYFEDDGFGVTEENIQARIRGVFLMGLSNNTNRLVLACGNKSELAVGYCTLYGDMNGALAVIGDMPKMLVYDVAQFCNGDADGERIPQRILEKPPSAELRPDQKDEDSLPPYEVLDEILHGYLVEHRSIGQLVDQGFEEATVRRVIELVHRNEYKRWQAAPILKVTDKAFGMGWRYPLAASYQQ